MNTNHDQRGRFASGGGTHHIETKLYGPVAMRPATEAERKERKVPPAYTNAHVPVHPDAPISWQATAQTPKGPKTQTRYSTEHTGRQAAAKFERGRAFDAAIGGIRSKADREIESGGKNAHEALVVRLIHQTAFRNGGDDAQSAIRVKNAETGKREVVGVQKTFGASSLLTRHARVEPDGKTIRFDFIGKEGVRQQHTLRDPVLAAHIKRRQAEGRETLFDTNDGKVRDYVKKVGGDFKVHDFRTWHATATAAYVVQKIDARKQGPKDAKGLEAAKLRVAKVVARRLGNEPEQSLKTYINPEVFAGWQVASGG